MDIRSEVRYVAMENKCTWLGSKEDTGEPYCRLRGHTLPDAEVYAKCTTPDLATMCIDAYSSLARGQDAIQSNSTDAFPWLLESATQFENLGETDNAILAYVKAIEFANKNDLIKKSYDFFIAARIVFEDGIAEGDPALNNSSVKEELLAAGAEMIEKALANKDKVGAVNVDFRLGEIEHLPVADGYVDVIISNCVINLSPDKDQVFREAFRVLKPGGKLAVSDMVTDGPLPEAIKSSLSAWAGCIAGALSIEDYVSAIENAGFVDVQLERQYLDHELVDDAVDELGLGDLVEDRDETFYTTVISAKITAYKP